METPASTAPPVDVTQEVRFAVVMYGGVSLCIYINGVAQELLELSRVTAIDTASGELLHGPIGAGAVYRRIAQYLDSDETQTALLREAAPAAPIRTRFIVDVLSGTSAGGLNSLFLAKALANDQDMEGLKTLWMEEGEITRLLNDADSVQNECGLTKPTEPASLLNSQRMYKKLLEALDAMDFPRRSAAEEANAPVASGDEQPAGRQPSPHVNDLDCYITTTDLSGLPVRLKLDNAVATEQRHRNVFHFRYRGPFSRNDPKYRDAPDCNDFAAEHNPFLAFTGRCTSAFPFAFEPMRLVDIEPILRCWKRYDLPEGAEKEQLRAGWAESFYRDYVEAGCNFDLTSFGDGGYLDNKPFSYATRTLMRRRAELPVRRKLIYIDPSPEPAPLRRDEPKQYDFIENTSKALIELPRYETIREDIQAVLDRNKLLETVRMLTSALDEDVIKRSAARAARLAFATPKPYEERGLAERIAEDGISYGTYHRLRVLSVTRNLANLVSRAAGLDPESDECQAIRWMVEAWRDDNFAEEPEAGSHPYGSAEDFPVASGKSRPRSSQNSFLAAFDIDYRLRRIFFLQRRVAALSRLRPRAAFAAPDAAECPEELLDILDAPEALEAFRAELRRLKRELAEPLRILVSLERKILEDKTLAQMLTACLVPEAERKRSAAELRPFAKATLREILEHPPEAEARYRANAPQFDAIARRMEATFREEFGKARALLKSLETPNPGAALAPAARADTYANLLPFSPQDFDDYDAAIFPIQYGTDAGEANRVDIVRISPPDARQLINEETDPKKRRKLAGTAIFSFGAFLARFWRENDMLWGRLDAAEVLIRSLLQRTAAEQEPGLVSSLVEEAHRAILAETLTRAQREELWNFISEAFAATSDARAKNPPSKASLQAAVTELLHEFPDLDRRLRTVLRFAGAEDDEKLREYFSTDYEVRRQLVVAEQLRLATRAGRIVSRMLNVLAQRRAWTPVERHIALLPRIAAIVWGVVEISIPRTLGWYLWEDWRYRFYSTGVVLVVVGFFWQPVLMAGLAAIGLTFVVDAARWKVSDWIRGTRWFRIAQTILIVGVLLLVFGLAGWKGYELWQHGRESLMGMRR